MSCKDVYAALSPFRVCVETPDGARVTTHVLYPSFDPVEVYVVGLGGGFRVHDGGGAERSAWLHGRDEQLITKLLARYAARHSITLADGILTGTAPNAEWLLSAILAVANASAQAAHAIVERAVAAAESDLRERVLIVLNKTAGEKHVSKDFAFVGRSGKEHHFDFGVQRQGRSPILIDTVVPHHVSIAHKYVAFSDVAYDESSAPDRFAVFDKPLASDDAALMRQVADLVPFAALGAGTRQALKHDVEIPF